MLPIAVATAKTTRIRRYCARDGGGTSFIPPPGRAHRSRLSLRGYVLSRYPVLKIHHTVARQIARKKPVMPRLTPTLTSAIP
jgi:hypothetical protein